MHHHGVVLVPAATRTEATMTMTATTTTLLARDVIEAAVMMTMPIPMTTMTDLVAIVASPKLAKSSKASV
jgi:hypothetical protein